MDFRTRFIVERGSKFKLLISIPPTKANMKIIKLPQPKLHATPKC